jgi:hypothetical protein
MSLPSPNLLVFMLKILSNIKYSIFFGLENYFGRSHCKKKLIIVNSEFKLIAKTYLVFHSSKKLRRMHIRDNWIGIRFEFFILVLRKSTLILQPLYERTKIKISRKTWRFNFEVAIRLNSGYVHINLSLILWKRSLFLIPLRCLFRNEI